MKCNKGSKGFALFMALVLMCSFSFTQVTSKASNRVVRVTTSAELFQALKTALPGDEIVVAEGSYEGKLGTSASGHGSSFFNSDQEGTAEAPIILRSENPQNKSVLSGSRLSSGNVLRITGDYWIIKDLKVTYAQKGIMLDNSNYSKIQGCEVYEIGMEGIHLRDNSSYNLVENCTVTDTGLQNAAYGEGIYVGSAKNSWATYGEICDYNIIRSCVLGPNVAAEHVDIKEGTTGTIIEDCIMNGTGISGQNYADSFIDAKGNDAIIRGNTCYRNNNSIIVEAFQVHNQLPGWGLNNHFLSNTVYLDTSVPNVVNASRDTTAAAGGNVRIPAGNMYVGNVTNLDSGNEAEPEVPDPTDPQVPEEPADPNAPADTYDDSSVYVAGDIVVYQGKTYKARWWTQGTAPDPSNQWGVWELIL